MITVIKLGGSLLSAGVLPRCLDRIAHYPGKVLIVPGGGVFADQVRHAQKDWGFDDIAAHRMAILAMQQMALLFNSLKPDFAIFDRASKPCQITKPAIWSPDIQELDNAGIAANWDITSDSLAAWLAGQVAANELLLVKCCPLDENSSLHDLQQLNILDAGFLKITESACFKINLMNKDQFLSLA